MNRLLREVHHDTAFNLTGAHFIKNCIDVVDLVCADGRLNLAVGGKIDGFLQIETGTDDGTAHGDAVQHHIENRQREFTRW